MEEVETSGERILRSRTLRKRKPTIDFDTCKRGKKKASHVLEESDNSGDSERIVRSSKRSCKKQSTLKAYVTKEVKLFPIFQTVSLKKSSNHLKKQKLFITNEKTRRFRKKVSSEPSESVENEVERCVVKRITRMKEKQLSDKRSINKRALVSEVYPLFKSVSEIEKKEPKGDKSQKRKKKSVQLKKNTIVVNVSDLNSSSTDLEELILTEKCKDLDQSSGNGTNEQISEKEDMTKKSVLLEIHPLFHSAKRNRKPKLIDSEKSDTTEENDEESCEIEELILTKESEDLDQISGNGVTKQVNEKEDTTKESIPPEIHPLFHSAKRKRKLKLDSEKSDTTEENEESCENNLRREGEPNEILTIDIFSDDENHSKLQPEIHSTCKHLKNENELSGKTINLKELYYPIVSHVTQYCTNESVESSILKIPFSKNTESENCVKNAWNGLVGLIDVESVNYLNSIRNNTENEHFEKSCDVMGNSCIDSSQKTEFSSQCSGILNSQFSDFIWSDAVHFDANKMPLNSSIIAFKSWLDAWKSKFLKSSDLHSRTSSAYSDDEDSMDDGLSKAIIVYGHPGTGKTSIVNSLAAGSGFTVLEVNASSCRAGRYITSQLQEVFHSYHVHNTTVEHSKSISVSQKDDDEVVVEDNSDNSCESGDKQQSKSKLTPIENKQVQPNKHRKESAICAKSKSKNIMNFFSKTNNKSEAVSEKNVKVNIKDSIPERQSKKKVENNCVRRESQTVTNKISTLILFDDVDVVFEEDDGFWGAINSFLRTSKKPVVFTASRNLEIIRNNLDNDYETIDFNNIAEKIDCCEAFEFLNNDFKNCKESVLRTLITSNANDVRRSLLQLQFWNKTGIASVISQSLKENDQLSPDTAFEIDSWMLEFPQLNYIFADSLRTSVFSNEFLKLQDSIQRYHSLDSDVLYLNAFNILGCIDSSKWDVFWTTISGMTKFEEIAIKKESEDKVGKEESSVVSSVNDDTSSSWEVVKYLSDLFDDFSFCNSLKSKLGCHGFLWLSRKERLKKWSAGLPMCVDDVHPKLESTALEIITLITILAMRKCFNNSPNLFNKSSKDVNDLKLDDSFLEHLEKQRTSTENYFQNILSTLPLSQQLNVEPALDYYGFLKLICESEALKKHSFQRSRRFLHYFDSITLQLDPENFV